VLFTIYTNEHRGQEPVTIIVKYADDAAGAGLIEKGDETAYRNMVDRLVSMCDEDELELNVNKTKEMVIDFRKDPPPLAPLVIKGSEVTIVPEYDYLGTRVTHQLTWSSHIKKQTAKAAQRIYHLRKLREFRVDAKILNIFYKSVIESVMFFGVSVWGGNTTDDDNKKISRVRRWAGRITKSKPATRFEIYKARSLSLARKIMADRTHPLSTEFNMLPSGRRLRQPPSKTCRFRNSFIPNVTPMLNKESVW